MFGVSTRFIHEIVARFREGAVSELDSSAAYSGARASEGNQPLRGGGGGGSSRKGGGKQRRRGGSKKQAESDVSDEPSYKREEEARPSSDQHPVQAAERGERWNATYYFQT